VNLLELQNVTKRFRRGHRGLVALRDVSMQMDPGEVVCISGARGSGRTTLLRIAAGIEKPDEGYVRFAGIELQRASHTLWRQIVVCNTRFLPAHGRDVSEHVMMPLLAVRVSRDEASLRAHRALERVGAANVAFAAPEELIPSELMRVSLARAIVRDPRMVILDEPTNGVDPLERDSLLTLLQSVAHESAIAVLLTSSETGSVTGADRILRLSEGELLGRTTPTTAEVVQLRRSSSEPSA
jgi:ABC-type multidrug transport system ATPase subunit